MISLQKIIEVFKVPSDLAAYAVWAFEQMEAVPWNQDDELSVLMSLLPNPELISDNYKPPHIRMMDLLLPTFEDARGNQENVGAFRLPTYHPGPAWLWVDGETSIGVMLNATSAGTVEVKLDPLDNDLHIDLDIDDMAKVIGVTEFDQDLQAESCWEVYKSAYDKAIEDDMTEEAATEKAIEAESQCVDLLYEEWEHALFRTFKRFIKELPVTVDDNYYEGKGRRSRMGVSISPDPNWTKLAAFVSYDYDRSDLLRVLRAGPYTPRQYILEVGFPTLLRQVADERSMERYFNSLF